MLALLARPGPRTTLRLSVRICLVPWKRAKLFEDEIKFSPDELHRLVNSLCYSFVRASTPNCIQDSR